MKVLLLSIILSLIHAEDTPHKFFDHDDFNPADYNLFDSFEGYTWHKMQNAKETYTQFYIKKAADKEFAELLNITFDVDIIYINNKVKPKY